MLQSQRGLKPPILLRTQAGLTLVEVTLAIGVFTLAMSILLGLLAPMLSDLSDVIDADETQAIVNKVEVFLETFDDIQDVPAFQEVYQLIEQQNYLEVFVYRTIGGRTQVTDDMEDIDRAMESSDPEDMVDRRVFLALISPSQANRDAVLQGGRGNESPLNGENYRFVLGHRLAQTFEEFEEGFLAFNVEVYSYDAPAPDVDFVDVITANPPSEPGRLLTFSTAINP